MVPPRCPERWHTDVEGADGIPAASLGASPPRHRAGRRRPVTSSAPTSGSCSTAPARWRRSPGTSVSGFDGFFASQRATGGEATVTVVQFDDHDPPRRDRRRSAPRRRAFDRRPLRAARHRRRCTTPSGCSSTAPSAAAATPPTSSSSSSPTAPRTPAGSGPSSGCSPASATLRDRGWTFVFLGANQDSYASGGGLGVRPATRATSRPSPIGVQAAYSGL